MPRQILMVCATLVCLMVSATLSAAEPGRRTIIYDGIATEVSPPSFSLPAPNSVDLWVTLTDLKRATRFEVKPKGVCRDELCFPISKVRRGAFFMTRSMVTWFNLSEFARLVRQPSAYDEKHGVWYFGPRSEVQNGYLASLEAPAFTLPDINGKMHSLADFRGKKVLLVTWASW
jgi:hypothetical protein